MSASAAVPSAGQSPCTFGENAALRCTARYQAARLWGAEGCEGQRTAHVTAPRARRSLSLTSRCAPLHRRDGSAGHHASACKRSRGPHQATRGSNRKVHHSSASRTATRALGARLPRPLASNRAKRLSGGGARLRCGARKERPRARMSFVKLRLDSSRRGARSRGLRRRRDALRPAGPPRAAAARGCT